jgi:hypothetical protein
LPLLYPWFTRHDPGVPEQVDDSVLA